MGPKTIEREEVVRLRKKGLSYSEIKRLIPVSKSSLSLWLKEVRLTRSQIKRLRSKGDVARALGSIALKERRIQRTEAILKESFAEVGKMGEKDLWLIGTMLYWAEGHKQKEYHTSQRVSFNNSDPQMIKLYMKWLRSSLGIKPDDIQFEIYIHETYRRTIEDLSLFWSKIVNLPQDKFQRVYYKKNKVFSYRKNRGAEYHGVLRIVVRRSTDLNRKITGWKEGVCAQFLA